MLNNMSLMADIKTRNRAPTLTLEAYRRNRNLGSEQLLFRGIRRHSTINHHHSPLTGLYHDYVSATLACFCCL